MKSIRKIHPDFLSLLEQKEASLIECFKDLRSFVLELYPNSNELLYHTHALTTVFAISEKMSDGFCLVPIYTNHLNLGFQKGTLLEDPHQLLLGTGKWMRHIPIKKKEDYRNTEVKALLKAAMNLAIEDASDRPGKVKGTTISKIKK